MTLIKKSVTVSLFIFWAVVAAILTAGLVFYQKNNNQAIYQNNQPSQNNGSPAAAANVLSSSEIAKHNSANDCYVIVDSKVYNLTDFLNYHSGGSAAILPYCGKDGTNAFNTKDGRGAHRSGDLNILASYYVGDLGQ